MSHRNRRKPPSQRRFRASAAEAPRLDPDLRRFVDLLTADCPARRHALYEAAACLDTPDVRDAFAVVGPTQRAAMLLAWKDALRRLVERLPCDFCPAVAVRVRFLAVEPGDDFRAVVVRDSEALLGFATLCGECADLPPAALNRGMLDAYAPLQQRLGPEPYRRTVLVGDRVGAIAHLPPGRHALMDCERCRLPTWFDPGARDLADALEAPESERAYFCRECAQVMDQSGRLESIPTYLLL